MGDVFTHGARWVCLIDPVHCLLPVSVANAQRISMQRRFPSQT